MCALKATSSPKKDSLFVLVFLILLLFVFLILIFLIIASFFAILLHVPLLIGLIGCTIFHLNLIIVHDADAFYSPLRLENPPVLPSGSCTPSLMSSFKLQSKASHTDRQTRIKRDAPKNPIFLFPCSELLSFFPSFFFPFFFCFFGFLCF